MSTRDKDLERLRNLTRDKNPSVPVLEANGPPPPGDDEGYSAAWCTEALRAGDVLDHGEVVAVHEATLGPDTPGFFGQLRRLHLDYSQPGAGPATIIAKRSSPEELNRAIGSSMGYYEREFRAYRQLAPAIPLRMPEHFYSALEGDRFVLLMQDLGGARCGNQTESSPWPTSSAWSTRPRCCTPHSPVRRCSTRWRGFNR